MRWTSLVAIGAAALGANAPVKGGGEEPRSVEFAIVDEGERPVLEGRMPIVPHQHARFEQRASRSPASQSLALQARPLEGGMELDLHWTEVSAEGDQLKWTPTLLVRRGDPTTASVSWGSGGRTVRITVR